MGMGLRRAYERDWEALARTEPLWGVLTDERYRSTRITPELEQAFWLSGETYVRRLSDLFAAHFGRALAPRSAIDFGCGVGRLLIPLARLSAEAVGIDASPTMLAHARAACDRAGLANVSLLPGVPSGRAFDFVNSALVLQHIPVRHGLRLLDQLLACLAADGLLAIQIVYDRPRIGLLRRAARWGYANLRPVRALANRWRGIASDTPYMQMNAYPLEQVFARLCAHGVSDVHVLLTKETGYKSAFIIGSKKAPAAQHAAA